MKGRFISILAAPLFFAGCSTIDMNPERIESSAYAPVKHGALADVSRSAKSILPHGHSGFHLIPEADEALHWRLALTDHATTSIDIQYYLWYTDEAGTLLLSRVLQAAERGVRVRILVDDLLFKDDETKLAALCHHPNVEIRIFNPQFVRKGPGATLEILARFGELNRRMHNQAFIVDNQLAVMGGRNIGNEYFGLGEKYNFVDLDVLTVGPVVPAASESFDLFWNSELSHPGEAFSPETGPEATGKVIADIHEWVRTTDGILAQSPFPRQRRDWSSRWHSLRSQWHTGTAALIDDAPTRAGDRLEGRFVEQALAQISDPADEEILFASPYLIPGNEVHNAIQGYHNRGVEVKLLTASMGANNHLMVHSHYRPHRGRLIDDGSQLYEFREDAVPEVRAFADTHPVMSDHLALHVKAGVGDRTRCFIGSLNLDPRAVDLNTENGLIIDSPGLAGELADFLDTLMADESAWQVTKTKSGALRWKSRGEILTRQPAPDQESRIHDFLWGLLPIGHLL
ncbi:MAG: phospholipase D family protein [Verrucomicrobiota bacterium]